MWLERTLLQGKARFVNVDIMNDDSYLRYLGPSDVWFYML